MNLSFPGFSPLTLLYNLAARLAQSISRNYDGLYFYFHPVMPPPSFVSVIYHLKIGPPDNRNHFSFDLGLTYWSEIPAVLCAFPVIT